MKSLSRNGLRIFGGVLIALLSLQSVAVTSADAQTTAKKKKKRKKSLSIVKPGNGGFHPTYDMGPGSVGSYFYSVAVGSSWKVKTVQRYYNSDNKVIAADSILSVETVTSNSTKSLQGLPLVISQSRSWRAGAETKVDTEQSLYYVDDSLLMAVFNNSTTNGDNRFLLVAPLRIGGRWLEKADDSIRTEIVSMHDTVTTTAGGFGNVLVTSTKLGQGELAKYFVPNVGLVKTVFRGVGRRAGTSVVITSELQEFIRGEDPPKFGKP
ncbi:MAG: hypothetical protein ABI444_08440 [Candidatus Kapaibacterium sp.]